ncbi:lactate racemase domain-containing protein [Halegenticoccus tardaugens]|uniref:lactate racemase domain-containing protein n=1 Tax=Halegenticoccus tardaugens TaxID=2071624 RepID=UPI00100B7A04|nr:lactate racemase domain-containing protein [Halegenticoccus tardaugens]
MELPLGNGTVSASLTDCDVTVVEPPGGDVVDPRTEAADALDDPHGPPLESVVAPEDTVAIVVTDVTRETPDGALLDVLLERLSVPRERISVVIGLGLHRPMTDEEIGAALGDHADLAENHDPTDVVRVGEVDGRPVEVNRTVAAADRVLATGMVEPHQYAGFSGGAKTVVIGAGSESMIRYTHGASMLSRSGVRLGRVKGNPFRETLDRAGDLAGPDFCLNVTYGPGKRSGSRTEDDAERRFGVLGASAGRPRDVVEELAETAREALSVGVGAAAAGRDGREGNRGAFDAVVAGVGAPKDANLYQATRAATYVILGDRNPLRPGGRVVVPAALPEGAGEGTGERRFYDRLRRAESPDALYEEMRGGYEPGAQRAFVVARALREHDVFVTNSDCSAVVEECLLRARRSIEDAIEPGSKVLVVPDALHTLLVD